MVSLAVMAAVAYFGYQYLVSSGLWAQWFGPGGQFGNISGGTTAQANLQSIASGLASGALVAAGKDAAGNTIVHDVASGLYIAVNPTTGALAQASGPGQLAVGSPGTVVTTPPVTQQQPPPAQTSGLQSQLQSAANQYMQASGHSGLNIDQWVFYYQTIKGVQLSGAQVESLIMAAGLSDATRSTIIPLSTFMNALGGVGLSGIVAVPNQGPIRAPIPTSQNFRGGYGGYGSAGRKGYIN